MFRNRMGANGNNKIGSSAVKRMDTLNLTNKLLQY